MNTKRIVTLHWYCGLSKEGLFRNSLGELIFANFAWEPESDVLAHGSPPGETFIAEIVSDTTFKQIARITIQEAQT